MELRLYGLDHFSKEDLDSFWAHYRPTIDDPKILGVNISCSNVCNLKCIYCYAGKQKKLDNELSLTEQQNILTQSKNLGAHTVVICGDGEPSMDPNLMGIVEHANHLGLKSIVVTNGIIFGNDKQCRKVHKMTGKEALASLYENNASFIVKLESIQKERYDHIVGVRGSYEKLMLSIDRIIAAGFTKLLSDEIGHITRLAFSAVIMRINIDELEDLKDFATMRNAQFICKLPSLVGRALENIDNMFEISKYEEIRKHLFGYTAKRETLMVDTPRCMAWHYGPCIGIDGEIRECYTSSCAANQRIGNIREDSLFDLVKRKNQIYDINTKDFCPVKSRINREFENKGMDKIWNIQEEGIDQEVKVLGY